MGKKIRRYSGDDLLHMAECVNAGSSAADLARIYGTDRTSMHYTLKRAGINIPDRSWTDAELATLRQMREAGQSFDAIEAALPGRGLTAVRGKINNLHIHIGGALGLSLKERILIGWTNGTSGHSKSAAAIASAPRKVLTVRTCQACRKPFGSEHIGNRRCAPCLSAAQIYDGPYAI